MDLDDRERQLGETRALRELRQQVQDLAAPADPRQRASLTGAHRRRPTWLLAAAILAIASLAAALVLVGLPAFRGGRVVGPEAASAADRMVAKMTSTWATASTISADIEFEMSRDYLKGVLRRRGTFIATTSGSARLETVNLSTDPEMDDSGVGARKTFVYDAASHRAASLTEPLRGRPSFSVVANATPDTVSGSEDSPLAYGASVQRLRNAMESGDQTVSVVDGEFDSRPAWIATWIDDVTSHTSGSERVWYTWKMVVDKETGLVLYVRGASEGAQDHGYDELSLSRVRLNEPLPVDAFQLKRPADAKSSSFDGGYRFGRLETVGAELAFPVMVPASVPPGFRLSDVATALREGSLRDSVQTHSRPMNPEPQTARRLQLWYRYGLGSITLNIEPVLPADGTVTREEIVAGLRWPTRRDIRVTTLDAGALAGATVYSWSTVEDAAVLVTADDLSVWIQGDGSPEELMKMANSLETMSE
jgi:hypothetical protein